MKFILVYFLLAATMALSANATDIQDLSAAPQAIFDLKQVSERNNYNFEVFFERRVEDTAIYGDLYLTFETHDSKCGVDNAKDLFIKQVGTGMFNIYNNYVVFRAYKDSSGCQNHNRLKTIRVKLGSFSDRKLRFAKIYMENESLTVNGVIPTPIGWE
jgi:hypothetical protein